MKLQDRKVETIMLKMDASKRMKLLNDRTIEISNWGYHKDDFVNNKISFIHSFISAN